MKKIIYILILIVVLYLWSLAVLKLNPNIEISKKETKCLPIFEYEEKWWIKILKMDSCTAYEMGKFHWEKLENDIKDLLNFFENEMLLNWKDKYLWGPIYSLLQFKAKQFVEYIPKQYLEEMKWIADWAGVSFNDILLINTYDDLLQIAWCSSMVIPKKDNFNGNFIHTRNLDYPIKILAKNKVVLKYNTHISVWFPGYIWVLTWVWEKWISLSNHTAYSVNEWIFWMPSGLIYRKILETAWNMDEVKNILKTENRTIANNLMIWSYKENIWNVAEFDSKEIDFREEYNENIIVSTNHFRSDWMKNYSTTKEGTRYKQYFEKVWKMDNINVDNLIGLLSYYKESKWWNTIANNGTIQSVIMIPELRKIYVANWEDIPVTDWEYIEIDF